MCVCFRQTLVVALLSVLFTCESASSPKPPIIILTKRTHIPFGELQLHLPSSLSFESLLLLQRTPDDAGCYCEVAVVAVVGLAIGSARQRPGIYVRPAAFQAKVILRVGG